jgi:hypothetical protein
MQRMQAVHDIKLLQALTHGDRGGQHCWPSQAHQQQQQQQQQQAWWVPLVLPCGGLP